jgi:phosphatidylethanolamine N-methyltransferase
MASVEQSGLRERTSEKPQQLDTADEARQRVLELNEREDSKDDKEKRTYGRTPDGTGKCFADGYLQHGKDSP